MIYVHVLVLIIGVFLLFGSHIDYRDSNNEGFFASLFLGLLLIVLALVNIFM